MDNHETTTEERRCSGSAVAPCYTLDDALFDLVQMKYNVGCLGMRQITDSSWMRPQRMSNKQAKSTTLYLQHKMDQIKGLIENEIKER